MKHFVVIAFMLVFLSGHANFLEAQEKSTAVALGLSIGIPVAGCVTTYALESSIPFLLIFAVGPSTGHFYAEQWTTGLIFTGLRTATMTAFITWAMIEVLQVSDFPENLMEGGAVLSIGFAVCCTITAADWICVPGSVRRWNERVQLKPEINLRENRYGVGLVYRL